MAQVNEKDKPISPRRPGKVLSPKKSGGNISSQKTVDAFLAKVARTPVVSHKESGSRSRLIFALDATASRSPSWDSACDLQGQMFTETAGLGGLSIQLCYYRGFNGFHSSNWHTDTHTLLNEMSGVRCLGGHTQIAKVLSHGLKETQQDPVRALVFIGDAVEEKIDDLCNLAGQLGLLNVPVFIFQEGYDSMVRQAFEEIARLSGGAYAPFDLSAAGQLRELLTAVAVFAAGGRLALEKLGKKRGGAALRLTQQLKR